jgi:thymidylate synthase (FAD)
MQVKLVSATQIDSDYLSYLMSQSSNNDPNYETFLKNIQTPEGLTAYIARVSSNDQQNHNYEKLLNHCMKNGHCSVFEMIDVTFEIITTRAISSQLLRHKSLQFSEFSQRYQSAHMGYELFPARKQDTKNRQNSTDDMDDNTKSWWESTQNMLNRKAFQYYEMALEKNIAKEIARAILPMSTQTKIYAKGTLRSWIHYLSVRGDVSTQKEHRDIAVAIKDILIDKYPSIAKACEWSKS